MIELINGEGTRAVVNPEGAFVESLELADRTPLLFARRDMPMSGKNRGGIPVCAPIFGPGETVGLNQHGFARNLRWDIAEQTQSRVKLTLDNPASQTKDTPSAYAGLAMELLVELLGNGLRETLTLRNIGTEPCVVNPAFHPYFPIPSGATAEQAEVVVDNQVYRLDADALAATRKVDSVEPVAVLKTTDGLWTVSGEGLPLFAIWSESLEDFICVEPTESGYLTDNAPRQLLPGDSTCVSMTILYE